MPTDPHRDPAVPERWPAAAHQQKLHALRLALIAGEQSGVAGPLDMDQIKQEARDEVRRAL